MADMQESVEVVDLKGSNDPRRALPARLKTGLLIAGSALFGGIAVVLWNRRTLAKMQNQTGQKVPKEAMPDEDAIY